MKSIVNRAIFICIALGLTTIVACNRYEESFTPEQTNTKTLRISLELPGNEAETRLAYVEEAVGDKIVMKTLWENGDQIVANPSPGYENYAYKFDLVSGAGTGIGVFESSSWKNHYSEAWIIYYPGSKISTEADYLNFSYTGQVQRGNNNLDHLKDFHSIRLKCSPEDESIQFNTDLINLSGEEHEESGCMKFVINNLPESIVPTNIQLTYLPSAGNDGNIFYEYNLVSPYYTPAEYHLDCSSSMNLGLEGFEATTSITAYMMLSNYDVSLAQGGQLRVTVSAEDGKKYESYKDILKDATLYGGKINRITCTEWEEVNNYDGFNNPDDGIVILQEASQGSGVDIFIMGDGFSATEYNFGKDGYYDTIMRQGYEDFFSIEPYKTLKPYFNVYYINAVSKDEHDATPLMNGATQGTASTIFGTQFVENSTSISGNNDLVMEYAEQILRVKGGPGGTAVTDDDEITARVNNGLCMVMVNVKCHAGTCTMYYNPYSSVDYVPSPSIAYTSLGADDEGRKYTTIHEAGGHGFGKLADEYGGYIYTSFATIYWNNLNNEHNIGLNRNVNEYYYEGSRWVVEDWPYTTAENVYWAELLSDSYPYVESEGLGIYEGAKTMSEMFCRPTDNSVMRSQFAANGKFFNAISRWAIWYRLMRITGSTSATSFKESLDEFIAFDSTISVSMNSAMTKSSDFDYEGLLPLAPPVMVEGRWEDGKFVK